MQLVAGIGVHDTAPRDLVRKAMQLAEEAVRAGATSLLIHPPRALAGKGDRRLVEYHAALGEFGLPLIAFELYEAAAGLTYSDLVWRELFEMPAVAAVKFATLDSPMRVQDLVALARGTGTMLITGEDRFLGASLMYGCEAALVGVAAARPRLTVELVDAWMTGDFARFRSASSAVDEFAGETFRTPMEGYIRRLLEVLVVDGWIEPSATADPWGPALDDVDLARIRSWAIATRLARRPVGRGLD